MVWVCMMVEVSSIWLTAKLSTGSSYSYTTGVSLSSIFMSITIEKLVVSTGTWTSYLLVTLLGALSLSYSFLILRASRVLRVTSLMVMLDWFNWSISESESYGQLVTITFLSSCLQKALKTVYESVKSRSTLPYSFICLYFLWFKYLYLLLSNMLLQTNGTSILRL